MQYLSVGVSWEDGRSTLKIPGVMNSHEARVLDSNSGKNIGILYFVLVSRSVLGGQTLNLGLGVLDSRWLESETQIRVKFWRESTLYLLALSMDGP